MICTSHKSSGPPSLAEEMRMLLCKTMPGSVFGLIIYTVQLLRGALAPELRKTITIALAIGWTIVGAVALLSIATAPSDMTTAQTIAFVFNSSFLTMIFGGFPVYNRANYGFYL